MCQAFFPVTRPVIQHVALACLQATPSLSTKDTLMHDAHASHPAIDLAFVLIYCAVNSIERFVTLKATNSAALRLVLGGPSRRNSGSA